MRYFLLISCFFTCTLAQADELWVGSYFGDNIKRFDLSNGTLKGTAGVGKVDGPLGMSIGPDGQVYASSEVTGSIEKFDTSGNWLSRFTTANSPTGITFDGVGNSYVAQFDTDSVTKFAPNGGSLGTFVSVGSGGLDGPDLGVTFGPDGNLYVPSFNSGDVLRYNGQTGEFMNKFIASGSGGMSQPRQMIWRDGKVFVSSDNGNRVLRYDGTTGAFLDTFVSAGSGGLLGAASMVFYGDSLYVTSWRNNKILRFDGNTGAFKDVFVSSGLNGPVSLLVVPEPGTLAGIGVGLASLARKRYRSRK